MFWSAVLIRLTEQAEISYRLLHQPGLIQRIHGVEITPPHE
jgi:hypothetical protein